MMKKQITRGQMAITNLSFTKTSFTIFIAIKVIISLYKNQKYQDTTKTKTLIFQSISHKQVQKATCFYLKKKQEFSLKSIVNQTVSLFLEAILDDEKALEVLTFNLEGKYDNLT